MRRAQSRHHAGSFTSRRPQISRLVCLVSQLKERSRCHKAHVSSARDCRGLRDFTPEAAWGQTRWRSIVRGMSASTGGAKFEAASVAPESVATHGRKGGSFFVLDPTTGALVVEANLRSKFGNALRREARRLQFPFGGPPRRMLAPQPARHRRGEGLAAVHTISVQPVGRDSYIWVGLTAGAAP